MGRVKKQVRSISSRLNIALSPLLLLDQAGSSCVVFLDINMSGESGFDLWKYFPNPSFNVVFITAYSKYALKAIRLSALDYLLKPIDIDELRQVKGTATCCLFQKKGKNFCLSLLEGFRFPFRLAANP